MKHAYENAKGQTITEVLPNGRFLKAGERLEKGDWRLWADSKHNTVFSRFCWWGQTGEEVGAVDLNRFYRPTKPKYRILKSNEIIRKEDQLYNPNTRGWSNAGGMSYGQTVRERLFAGSLFSRIRRPVKTK